MVDFNPGNQGVRFVVDSFFQGSKKRGASTQKQGKHVLFYYSNESGVPKNAARKGATHVGIFCSIFKPPIQAL